jgi:hypothetical protein
VRHLGARLLAGLSLLQAQTPPRRPVPEEPIA